ncbi:hypothetical protein [Mucilaginibacter sp. SP1R1]|uniref:hypothetical protein n=1 Tax=Mucilaginibacter sp. SP1R1 TaxID=2723091 RepID=UPI00160BE503|nr:hypothetical protein [Mucilaginibacter sp. SP1R1]MBB6150718.1 hypothetical protein [Mucilaginibacter sp. SP1R1]
MFKIKGPHFYFRLTESITDVLCNTLIVLLPILVLFHSTGRRYWHGSRRIADQSDGSSR